MKIVPITCKNYDGDSQDIFYTIKDLISLLNEYPTSSVCFAETELSPCCVLSWRGCYNLPAILAGHNGKNAYEIADDLEKGLDIVHEGYKGGEYTFTGNEEFRVVTDYSRSDEHGVFGYSYNSETDILELKTAINYF